VPLWVTGPVPPPLCPLSTTGKMTLYSKFRRKSMMKLRDWLTTVTLGERWHTHLMSQNLEWRWYMSEWMNLISMVFLNERYEMLLYRWSWRRRCHTNYCLLPFVIWREVYHMSHGCTVVWGSLTLVSMQFLRPAQHNATRTGASCRRHDTLPTADRPKPRDHVTSNRTHFRLMAVVTRLRLAV